MQSNNAIGVSTPVQVVGETKRKNRKRTKRATELRQLNAVARTRQNAWLQTGKPNLTGRLTHDLEEGFEALRLDRVLDRAPSSWVDVAEDTERVGVEWLPYFGRGTDFTR
jgi:hypothetical protein